MKKIAVFAGSFDPFTLGHLDVVKRASALFDTLWIVVAQNANKKNLFDCVTRAKMAKKAVAGLKNVKVAVHEGLTVDFMKSVGADFLVRGIRGACDLDFEQSVAWNNKTLCSSAETVLLLSASEHLAVSSSVVRELLLCGESLAAKKKTLAKFVPSNILNELLTEFGKI
ncbi:MAG: pantetheine-phosphate adenylyltransferase [Fibrobacter sp.]|jgi:pantetheine-phosphate adenylyltransferase|uniref:pantetheine-phosphate adenylyltransferase n=1 Tax=Fibrobacter sp. UWP2 TaxID=1896216 RepID=UPI00091A9428|nr:pantetheine-phosphate adenylyltransferase [Fibrobacter sp. UWP2]MBO7384263.1 pantetheine-phosphate adenylyltransferase [Fibrobacter sp.]SHJ00883.1 Phosphopantetheine adenylyltransferase [Fibrobacter sp. UWP2]